MLDPKLRRKPSHAPPSRELLVERVAVSDVLRSAHMQDGCGKNHDAVRHFFDGLVEFGECPESRLVELRIAEHFRDLRTVAAFGCESGSALDVETETLHLSDVCTSSDYDLFDVLLVRTDNERLPFDFRVHGRTSIS